MAEVESQGTGDREGRGWGSLLIWLPGLLVLYVLSVGPVARLSDKGIIPDEPARTIYAPLIWLDWHSPAASHFLDWYVHLWGGR